MNSAERNRARWSWRESALGRGAELALDTIFAEECAGCGGWARRARFRLCLPCRSRLRLDQGACRSCSRPAPDSRGSQRGHRPSRVCGACLRRPPPVSRCTAVWQYREPLDALLQQFKFGRDRVLGEQLAREAFARRGAALRHADLLVPVPLHWSRQAVRSFNQAAVIAEVLAEKSGRPVVAAVRRRRRGRAQSRLPRDERLTALRGIFGVHRRKASAVRGRRVVIVDDVVTTGSTLTAVARTLRGADAKSVEAFVLARATL